MAAGIYGASRCEPYGLVGRLVTGNSNYTSNFIDVGGAVQLRDAHTSIASIRYRSLRCKGLFRLWPTLRVKASGEISVCPHAAPLGTR